MGPSDRPRSSRARGWPNATQPGDGDDGGVGDGCGDSERVPEEPS